MTDRELMELILQKINGIATKLDIAELHKKIDALPTRDDLADYGRDITENVCRIIEEEQAAIYGILGKHDVRITKLERKLAGK